LFPFNENSNQSEPQRMQYTLPINKDDVNID
jgi:hypothetical protein